MSENDNKYRRRSMIITAGVQVVVLIVLYMMVAWREIIPPLPEYGIELSFGIDQSNSEQLTSEPQPVEEQEIEEDPTASESESVDPEEASEDLENISETVTEEPVTEVEDDEPEALTEDINSPDITETETIETSVSEQTPEPEVAESQEVGQPTNQVDEANEITEDIPEKVEEPVIDERALYNATSGTGESRGATLQLAGWKLMEVPDPQDESQESGKIVFEIKVDGEGYIISIKTLTSTVTPAVELRYRRSVEQLVLEKN